MSRPSPITLAALAILAVGATAARAEVVSFRFSGTASSTSATTFIDPTGNTSTWGSYAGSLTWDTTADTIALSATIYSTPDTGSYTGPLTIFDNSYAGQNTATADVSIANGVFAVSIADRVDSFSGTTLYTNLVIVGDAIVAGQLPTAHELTSSSNLGGQIVLGDSSSPTNVSNLASFDVPEPVSLSLLGLGFTGLAAVRRRTSS